MAEASFSAQQLGPALEAYGVTGVSADFLARAGHLC